MLLAPWTFSLAKKQEFVLHFIDTVLEKLRRHEIGD
jgi:hypothetical protein